LDLASSLEVGSTTQHISADASQDEWNLRSVLTIAFQFPYEMHLQDSIAIMARQYVRSILSSVQRMSMTISPSQSGLNTGHKIISGFPEAATLVQWICQSYQYVHLSFSFHFQAFYCQGSCAELLESMSYILYEEQFLSKSNVYQRITHAIPYMPLQF
jgi:hypothetical protein